MPSHFETYHPNDYVAPDGSWASSDAIRRTMLHNRARDTQPELALRSLLHRQGLRYRVAFRPLQGVRRSADLTFTRSRVAVFVDGCFWHACPKHFVPPATNTEYWRAKIAQNVRRDRHTDALFADAGWEVVRIWEHELAVEAATRVQEAVRTVDARRRGSRDGA